MVQSASPQPQKAKSPPRHKDTKQKRIALIFTYGLANDYTFEFAKRSMRRQLDDTPGTSPLLPPKLRAAFAAQQVLLAEDHFRNLRHAHAADTPRNT